MVQAVLEVSLAVQADPVASLVVQVAPEVLEAFLAADPVASLVVQVAPEVPEVSLAAVAVDNKLDHLPLHHRISHPNNHSSKHSRLIQVEFEAVYSDSPIFG